MRIAVSIIALLMVGVLVAPSEASRLGSAIDAVRGAGDFVSGAFLGTYDMWRSYSDMREANFIGADKYFHARGNFDAAQRGSGGIWAATVISDAREALDRFRKGGGAKAVADSKADQFANRWGRYGGDPNDFRPKGLPDKYLSRNKYKESSPHP